MSTHLRVCALACLLLAGAAQADPLCRPIDVIPFQPRVDYASRIQPVWDQHCTQCHLAGSGFLDLSAQASGADLVNRASPIAPDQIRVRPGQPLQSLLVRKLRCLPPFGSPMPPNFQLDVFTLATIDDWVLGGALYPGDGRISYSGFEARGTSLAH